jgi:hypothetical protein
MSDWDEDVLDHKENDIGVASVVLLCILPIKKRIRGRTEVQVLVLLKGPEGLRIDTMTSKCHVWMIHVENPRQAPSAGGRMRASMAGISK